MKNNSKISIVLIAFFMCSTLYLSLEPRTFVDESPGKNMAVNTGNPPTNSPNENGPNPHRNWVNSTADGTNFTVELDSQILIPNNQIYGYDIDSSQYYSNQDLEVKVIGNLPANNNDRHKVEIQLWGNHKDSNGQVSLIRHGNPSLLNGTISSSISELMFDNLQFYSNNPDEIAQRLDGCYWVEARVWVGTGSEQYLVVESPKINFAPIGTNHCPEMQISNQQLNSDYDDDGWPDYFENLTGDSGLMSDINMNPISDSDLDGVPDYNDDCKDTESLYIDTSGCPILDTDGDGVFNHLDLCTSTPLGSYVDSSGCHLSDNSEPPVSVAPPEESKDEECELTKFNHCEDEILLVGGGIIGGTLATSVVNKLRVPKKKPKENTIGKEEVPKKESISKESAERDGDIDFEKKNKKEIKSEINSIPIFIIDDANSNDQYLYELNNLVDGSKPNDRYASKDISNNNWANVSENGMLSGTPSEQDIGLTRIQVRVTNSHGLWADVEIRINVSEEIKSKNNNPPKWINS